jgi:DNA helicase-2/ATP-dependent DNA helicase PcrA
MSDETEPAQTDFLRGLNPQQREAVTHPEQPLLIVAGAGTGKTTTLAHRVAWQIVNGVAPEQILLLTFTRRAAFEMLRRVEGILTALDVRLLPDPGLAQSGSTRRIRGGTFHSVATGLLRRYGQRIGLYPDFTILDRSDSEDLLNLVRTEHKLPQSGQRFPLKGTCLDIYSRCVNTQLRIQEVLERWFPWCVEHQDKLAELFTAYVARKESQRVLDFDDLLLFWNALAEHSVGTRSLGDEFRRILVDEYQDTNVLQARILKAMCPTGIGLTAVGDDAQSIYSFRAATVRNILDFPEEYPGTTLVALEQNYRSTQPILDVTNRVIEEAAERHHKKLWSDRESGAQPALVTCSDEDTQNEYIIDRILERREEGVPLRQQAVLFRASHHSMALEAELGRRNIPFQKYGGLRFLETAHIRDLLAFLRLAENPYDSVTGLRVLVLLPGIGPAKATTLIDLLRDGGGQFETWKNWKPPSAARDDWPRFVSLLQKLSGSADLEQQDVSAELQAVRKFYTPLLKSKYDNVQSRLNDLRQLEVIAGRYPSRSAFLTEMTLDPPTSTQELPNAPHADEDYLVLSTIHSAKGLEWDSVFVIHAADGNIPSDMATGTADEIEEERRLFYVAMTRAKNLLHVVRPERYYFHHRRRSDQHSLSRITRFLPAAVQKMMTRKSCGNVCGDGRTGVERLLADHDTTEIRRRISRLWQ